MVERLKQEGTSHSSSDLLKINVKMDDSWTAQALRQTGETPSGLLAFLIFCLLKTLLTSSSQILITGWETVGGRGGEGVNGCVVGWSVWVWGVRPGFCFWKPTVKTVQVFSQLLIGLSAGGRGLVAGDGFSGLSHWCRGRCLKAVFLAFQRSSSLPLLSPYSVCIWPVCTRLFPHSCRRPLWPGEAVLSFVMNQGLSLLNVK